MKSDFSSLMIIPVDLGFEIAEGVGIMMISCCEPREVWWFMDFIVLVKDGWVRCSEPFKNLVLSLEAVCVGVLEV